MISKWYSGLCLIVLLPFALLFALPISIGAWLDKEYFKVFFVTTSSWDFVSLNHYHDCEIIQYLLWNRGACCSLNNIYQIFLARVHLVHWSFMWVICLKWHKSTFYPVTTPNDLKMLTSCDIIVTWAGHWQLWRHNDQLFSLDFYTCFLITMALGSVI